MEAFVHGVSTRKVDDLVHGLGIDAGVSKSHVSRICAELDAAVTEFRERRLDHIDLNLTGFGGGCDVSRLSYPWQLSRSMRLMLSGSLGLRQWTDTGASDAVPVVPVVGVIDRLRRAALRCRQIADADPNGAEPLRRRNLRSRSSAEVGQ